MSFPMFLFTSTFFPTKMLKSCLYDIKMTMEASKHNFCADRTCRIVSQEGKLRASNSSCPKFAAILYNEKV